MSIEFRKDKTFEISVPVVVIGAGACGLVAALAARDAGCDVVVLERDAQASGSTALSSGFIPACDTRFQRERGVRDSVERMVADIQAKNHQETDPDIVTAVCRTSGPAIEWLADRHGLPIVLVEGFLYPGHSAFRMHAVAERTGAALMAALLQAASTAGVDILTSAKVHTLFVDDSRRVLGVAYERPDGTTEEIGCAALILACSGFGGNPNMVRQYLPEIAGGLYFGHAGNQGDAMSWGEELGAALADMSAYQGHGSVATPHNVLITWALMMEGGVQVNSHGERFSNEHLGYSEQCLPVLEQPGQVAWCLYDQRCHDLAMDFDDYRNAFSHGAVQQGRTLAELASRTGLPLEGITATIADTADFAAARRADPFGRDFTRTGELVAPYFAVKVTGALFHTQGGLVVNGRAQVIGRDGQAFPNLFAGGGAARGVSGAHVWGYLSGNGLLTAVTLGFVAGQSAAALLT